MLRVAAPSPVAQPRASPVDVETPWNTSSTASGIYCREELGVRREAVGREHDGVRADLDRARRSGQHDGPDHAGRHR